ncbi:hypothetical protein J6S88_05625 [bacterium]|nr:hypothetical protein [bacterium]
MLNTSAAEHQVSIEEIRNYYVSGCKKNTDCKIGLEYERLPISVKTGKNTDYSEVNGINTLLKKIGQNSEWSYITDAYNIIGLRNPEKTITLEPGCQFEYSISPLKSVSEINSSIEKTDKEIKKYLDELGITLLNYGVSPVVTFKNINLIPKRRYKIMAKYMWGILADVMMRETAGFQCAFDYESEEDAARKFIVANKLSPFVTAMFANSPVRGGVDTGYKSFRALSWLNTDNERCGFAFNLDDAFTFDTYIGKIMKAPVIFIEKEGLPVEINGRMNFENYMQNGFEGFVPTMKDYMLSANLCFPEVRLNDFIEIRNQDCNRKDLVLAGLALYKGIMYDKDAMAEVENLFRGYKHIDFSELRYDVPRSGMESEIQGQKISDICKEIIKISENSLKKLGEEKYLDSIKEYTMSGISPADEILKNWYGSWDKNPQKLIEWIMKQNA